PDNYLYAGLMALLFPRATLIYVRRDVRDVALSCWMTHFGSIRWADTLDNLARRVGEHRRLMAHWRAGPPPPGPEGCLGGPGGGGSGARAPGGGGGGGLKWGAACREFPQAGGPVPPRRCPPGPPAALPQTRRPLESLRAVPGDAVRAPGSRLSHEKNSLRPHG